MRGEGKSKLLAAPCLDRQPFRKKKECYEEIKKVLPDTRKRARQQVDIDP